MREKKSNVLGRLWLTLRLTWISFIVYLIMAGLFFVVPVVIAAQSGSPSLFRDISGSYIRPLMGVFASVYGCVVGAVGVSGFGSGRKGDLLRLLPERKETVFVYLSACELLKAFIAAFIAFAPAFIFALIQENAFNAGGAELTCFFLIFGECVCYMLLYFSVGVLFASFSGRAVTTVLGCAAYYLGSGIITYIIMGIQPYMTVESGGFLSLIRAPFIHNAPFFRLFYSGMPGYGAIFSLPSEYGCLFNGALSLFGMLFTAAVFYALGVLIFRYRRVETLGEPYCFPFIAPAVTSVLTVECYLLALISPWKGLDVAIERVNAVFSVGKVLPGTEYVTVFVVAFLLFSALTNCSARHIFRYLKLLPVLAVATYIFQILWLGGVS